MSLPIRQPVVRYCLLALFLIAMLLANHAQAQEQDLNVLAECRELSLELDQIHNCMDQYLDALDENMQAINEFLMQALSGDALSGLSRSQEAFVNYRQQNCLWYLNFSSPRSDAEQIAKNCLVTMSTARLEELQGLVSSGNEDDDRMVEGFFVYGEERNSFQPCGSTSRYWVEGDADAVGLLQQRYLAEATSDRQLLYAIVLGTLNNDEPTFAAHQGVLELISLIELRVPTDLDCNLPNPLASEQLSNDDIDVPDLNREVFDDEQEQPQDEAEQQLVAFFGDWLVSCTEFDGLKSCALAVDMLADNASPPASDVVPRLTLNRTDQQGTFVQVDFPDREIDSPALIRWQIDDRLFGDIVSSEIRVDQLGARQLISESDYLTKELLPAMITGSNLYIRVLQSVDDEAGDELSATLKGLTKALGFADDFIRDQG